MLVPPEHPVNSNLSNLVLCREGDKNINIFVEGWSRPFSYLLELLGAQILTLIEVMKKLNKEILTIF